MCSLSPRYRLRMHGSLKYFYKFILVVILRSGYRHLTGDVGDNKAKWVGADTQSLTKRPPFHRHSHPTPDSPRQYIAEFLFMLVTKQISPSGYMRNNSVVKKVISVFPSPRVRGGCL